MKHRKVLSALLALVMVMALAVPALAEETEYPWFLSVSENDDWTEMELQLQQWTWTWNFNEDVESYETSQSDTTYAGNVLKFYKGETAKLVHNGLSFYGPCVTAWSDPDGDGVYTQRWFESTYSDGEGPLHILPIGATTSEDPRRLSNNYAYFKQDGLDLEYAYALSGAGYYPYLVSEEATDDEYGIKPGNGATLYADVLLELYGPNTLLEISAYDAQADESRFWKLLLVGTENPAEPAQPTQPAEPVTPAQPEQPAAPTAGTYTVRQWDTWGQLALNNYGTYAAWPALRRANGNKPLSVGMTVTLPEKLGSYARLAPQVLAEGEKFYTVKAGDTLGQIAVTEYGSFMMYKDIFQRNSDRLKNVNSIYEGQILVLPAKK